MLTNLTVEQIITLITSIGTLATLFGKIWMDVQNNRDRIARNDHVVAKIDENTVISKNAFDVANHVNEKIADVAERADKNAVASMADVMREVAAIRLMSEQTHKVVTDAVGKPKG